MFSILITSLTEKTCNVAMRSFTQIAVRPLRFNILTQELGVEKK